MDNKQGAAALCSMVALMLGSTGCGDGDSESSNVDSAAQGVKCQGINDCMGMAECAGPDGENDCQGMNACAGMGWVTVDSEDECEAEGGTVIE